jgi:beta-aspartyl-peptidase (threonine type)
MMTCAVFVRRLMILIFISISLIYFSAFAQQSPNNHPIKIVIHGGAGTILKVNMPPAVEREYREKLTEALMTGYDILRKGGTSLDAVESTINVMEDSPLFNAGKGAVFTHEGTNELDASIMDGRTLMAGAVAGVKHIKNPISLARLVMEKSPHVLMAGAGAEAFALEQGMDTVPQSYFYTERRWNQLQKILDEARRKDSVGGLKRQSPEVDTNETKHGTVGCLALDQYGNLAAGTSTGGLTNKRFGRIGDSPIIGAGNYANNQTCAVSGTGDGEYFIRLDIAHDISAMMEYEHLSVQDAASAAIEKLTKLGGTGGVIALDRNGNFAMLFNTSGMYRAYIDDSGKPVVLIYK